MENSKVGVERSDAAVISTCLSLTWTQCNLRDGATCTIHATSPPVLRLDWKTLARLTSTRSKPLDLNALPAPPSIFVDFMAQPKSVASLFLSPNPETVMVILRHKSPNCSCQFWGLNRETLHHRFWDQTGRTRRHRFWGQIGRNRPSGFEAKSTDKPSQWFWGQTTDKPS
jgi:hypothetical protein